jgi:4-amino-4-deoxy-L-arabinose transferase-like glycosyltransferase
MHWLQSLDVAGFHFANGTLRNFLFDRIMPILSDNAAFAPVVVVGLVLLFWKGGLRGRLAVFALILAVGLGDSFVCKTIKKSVQRVRPCAALPDAIVSQDIGCTDNGSMPSSHAANWFAATTVALIYFRRRAWLVLIGALLVSFSRVYNGVHYPSDVLAGAVLGAGYTLAGLVVLDAAWRAIGRRWLPAWWERLPSIVAVKTVHPPSPNDSVTPAKENLDAQWLRFGYLLIAVLLLFRLAYLAAGKIDLSEDEAYQWTWSKHLALSYYSKPPLIALTQFAGTILWGDTAFGVRFFSPLIAALISLVMLRFVARVANARVAVAFVAGISLMPMMAVGATLMTIDPLSVLFWTAAMIVGWRAVQEDGATRDWLWTGLFMGFGFLSKYTNLFQWLCWLTYFAAWPPARKHLRKPGPYLALLVNILCTLPVLIWNAQHGWITVEHVSNDGRLNEPWHPTLKYVWEFIGAEAAILNPVFFIAMIWAALSFWKTERRNPLHLFLWSMGAPLFLFYFLFSFHSRVFPNWIAPSVVPLACLALLHWTPRWTEQRVALQRALVAATVIGLVMITVMHDTNLIGKLVHRTLPARIDPLRRVRGWPQTALVVATAQTNLIADGKPTFVIGDHYGMVGELSFYWPEARDFAATEQPLVYYRRTTHPENQFYFWPGYETRKGQNAIYVQRVGEPRLPRGWFSQWWTGTLILPTPEPGPPPAQLLQEFESVRDLGVKPVVYRDRVMRHMQLFECRNLR